MTGPSSETPRSMPNIDGTCLPPLSAPAALSPVARPGTEEEGSLRACGAAAVASLTGLVGTSLHSEPLMDYELRGAIVSPESMKPGPTVPSCAVGQPPCEPNRVPCQCPAQPAARLLGGISARWAWRPTASQADVMANSRHLAYLRDF